ncbi:MAG TPA: 3-phosphoshikimate 1-carboxyvinyltransferase [Chlamydiales bacterium]|nr:3-phosphoshikimate 1-carboxyvinyltransferase [Chlamydiales bacterium]
MNKRLRVPPSKSHTLRALIFALMAKGKSQIFHSLHSPDTMAMVEAIRQLGAKVEVGKEALIVEGVAGKIQPAGDVIQCGNSGQVLRFIGALSALSPSYTILTGDASIRKNRPVKPLLDALNQLGAFAVSSRLDGYAPIIIKGPLKGGKAVLSGEDSQPVSALIIAGAFVPLELSVQNPGEKPWVQLTLSWLDRLKIPYENHNFEHYRMKGGSAIDGFDFAVPGDFSSAAFPIAAALLTGSEMELEGLDRNDVQGDRAIIAVLEKMGARFGWEKNRLVVRKSDLQGISIDVNDFIDALPILAVIGCFAEGKTELYNGAIARKKESDRIGAMAMELRKMGAKIEERVDGMVIHHSPLRGANIESHGDHRVALALAVATLAARGESKLHGMEVMAKSYPTFLEDILYTSKKN